MKLTDYVLIVVTILCAIGGTALVVDNVNTRWGHAYAVQAMSVADPNLSGVMDCVVHVTVGSAEGSGCFISADGIVLTARHVLEHADGNDVIVTLRNGLTYKATACYTPPTIGSLIGPDVGFLKVDYYHPTRYLHLERERPALGAAVWCLGHPYGDGGCPWSVTRGIVSAVQRDCQGAYGIEPGIQIDAAAYPGNSGGPVVNDEGRVVGVLVGGLAGRECLSICVPAEAAIRWLDVFRAMLEARP